ncbi:interleukin-6 receptor subunit alpha [Ochotona curzoniae]|uniref:interleukin-6 receptor subunit alpha n=1 Tax=Ochotona curzoniae TaxID=130825 RepID=UPI001B3528ED|nr:interleukin-6 receptor subunit alpha [Ochotona curzoniae]
MCKWEVALTPSSASGSSAERRAGPRDSRRAPRARLRGMGAAFGARAHPAVAALFPPAFLRMGVTLGGGSKLAVRCALLAALLAAGAASLIPGACLTLEMGSHVVSSQLGANVNLSCPAVDPAANVTVQWLLRSVAESTVLRQWAGVGGRLLLKSVQLQDSGNYSCYLDDHPAGSVYLLVDVPPEKPRVSCFRRSFDKPVTCEWHPQRPPSATTRAMLEVKKYLNSQVTDLQEPCPYSQESQKFSCQLVLPSTDKSSLFVSLCVANSISSTSSLVVNFDSYKILQPDPPTNITVSAVSEKPHWLSITWQDPVSWNSNFYRLRFQIRYRAERSQAFTEWIVESGSHPASSSGVLGLQYQSFIYDAWKGMSHVVQLRAQEEFEHGSWSVWSEEVRGTPWTEPRSPPAMSPSPEASSAADDTTELTGEPEGTTHLPDDDSSPIPLSTFLVAGGSLAFGILLGTGLVLRFRKAWKLRALKEGKTAMHPPYALGQLVPERPRPIAVLVPLISPPVSPSSLGSDNTSGPSRPDAMASCVQSPYDISNKDYFFPR